MSSIDFEHIKTDMVNDVAVVQVLSKELRFPPQCQELGAELTLVAGQEWAKKLLVNLRHTKYLCSTGFAVLVQPRETSPGSRQRRQVLRPGSRGPDRG